MQSDGPDLLTSQCHEKAKWLRDGSRFMRNERAMQMSAMRDAGVQSGFGAQKKKTGTKGVLGTSRRI